MGEAMDPRSGHALEGAVEVRRVVDTPMVGVVRWRCARDTEALRAPRCHDEWVLTLVHDGAARVHSQAWAGWASPGVAVLHPPGAHYSTSHPRGCGDRGANIRIRSDAVEQLVSAARRAVGEGELLVAHPAPRVWLGARQLASAGAAVDPMRVEETVLALVEAMFPDVSKAPGPARPATDVSHREVVERAQAFVAWHYAQPLRLDDVARAAHASPTHLSRVFRRATGCGVHRFVRRRRIAAAVDRLIEGDEPLSRIALDVGFASHSHMSSAFRQELEATPREIRSQARRRRPIDYHR